MCIETGINVSLIHNSIVFQYAITFLSHRLSLILIHRALVSILNWELVYNCHHTVTYPPGTNLWNKSFYLIFFQINQIFF